MARLKTQYIHPPQRPAQLDRIDQSRFWLRLEELSKTGTTQSQKKTIDQLKACIRKVTDEASWIGEQISRFMPQYTLHEQRHFLNVLSIMDSLIPDECISKFSGLDCALPILAAFTHDLGMSLSQSEYDCLHDESTDEGKQFSIYRDRYDEELRHIEKWNKVIQENSSIDNEHTRQQISQAKNRIRTIEGYLLASYLRDTHTSDSQSHRLRDWLEKIKDITGDSKLFYYGNYDFQELLIQIDISHGREVSWLRKNLNNNGPEDRFCHPV